jgi:hypothetical protein
VDVEHNNNTIDDREPLYPSKKKKHPYVNVVQSNGSQCYTAWFLQVVRDVQRILQNIDINLPPLRKSAMLSLAVAGLLMPTIGIAMGVVAAVSRATSVASCKLHTVAITTINDTATRYVALLVQFPCLCDNKKSDAVHLRKQAASAARGASTQNYVYVRVCCNLMFALYRCLVYF